MFQMSHEDNDAMHLRGIVASVPFLEKNSMAFILYLNTMALLEIFFF